MAPGAFALIKTRLYREIAQLAGAPILHWVIHDIRRSVASQLAELKIPSNIVEPILNHRSGAIRGVAAIYNRYNYAAEKSQALNTWARRLSSIVSGASNVDELAVVRS